MSDDEQARAEMSKLYDDAKKAVKHREGRSGYSNGWNECRLAMLQFLAERFLK